MKSNPFKSSRKDKAWQQKIEKKVEFEKIKLDHPNGKEHFEKVIKNIPKKNKM